MHSNVVRRLAGIGTTAAAALVWVASAHAAPASWTNAQPMGSSANDVYRSQVATNAAGYMLVAWEEAVEGVPSVLVASRAPGKLWTGPQRMSTDAAALQNGTKTFDVAVSADGEMAVAYAVDTNGATAGGEELHARHKPVGGAWGSAVEVSFGGGQNDSSTLVRSANPVFEPNGDLTVLYAVDTDTADADDLRVNARTRSALTGVWGTRTVLSGDGNVNDNAANIDVGADAAGNITAVWSRFGVGLQTVSKPSGGTWPPPPSTATILSGGPVAGIPLSLDVASNGRALVAWAQADPGDSGKTDIYARRRSNGVWESSPLEVADGATNTNREPSAAVHPNGDGVVAYTAFPTGASSRVYAKKRLVGAGTWGAGAALSGATAYGDKPVVGVDNTAQFYAVFATAAPIAIRKAELAPGSAVWSPAGGEALFEPAALAAAPNLSVQPDGSAAVVYAAQTLASSTSRAYVSLRDGSSPSLTPGDIPTTATTGQPVSFSVTAADAWSGIAFNGVRFDFGDGNLAFDSTVSHAYGAAGTYSVKVVAIDDVGRSTLLTLPIVVTDPVVPAPPSGGGSTTPAPTPAPPGGGVQGAGDTIAPRVTILTKSVRPTKSKRVTIRLRCPATEQSCRTTLTLIARTTRSKVPKGLALKSGLITLKGGQTRTINLKIGKSGLAKLRAMKKVTLRIRAVATDAAGNRGSVTQTLVLRPRK